ncbi:LexA family transcriptional regulator [Collimonas fungivorans]|uniref:LexA family transcriptional regulator n=1 Tax=Collimonas fungivorans TaxID=158899 RepID=UPI001EE639FB|nr:LexA family transcriptional regulator [Collimonas fungivorans]
MANRIAEALERKGGNQSEMARYVGVSPQAVQKWIAGESEPRGKNLDLAAEFLGTSPAILKFGDKIGNALPKDYKNVVVFDPDNQDYIEIRRVKLKLSAGITGFTTESAEDFGRPISFRREWFIKKGYSPDRLVAIDVKGDSMEPTMSDGDTVVINTADVIPKNGETFAVNYEGEGVIKRLARDFGRWFLSSDNPDQRRYHRQECSTGSCIIIGKVILLQRETI